MADCSFGVILLRLSEEMYIQKAVIEHIKSIDKFEIEFPNPAGWHVLIGDNGSGKSTIVRAIALALIGENQIDSLRENLDNWLNSRINISHNLAHYGAIKLDLSISEEDEVILGNNKSHQSQLFTTLFLKKSTNTTVADEIKSITSEKIEDSYTSDENEIVWNLKKNEWIHSSGFFSVAFGPYRRFEGGNSEWEKVYDNPSLDRSASHLSIFNESVALTEPIKWLKKLDYESLRDKPESKHTLENLTKLINYKDKDKNESFLQHDAQLEEVRSDGVFFKDGNGTIISVNQMSDGYRSILSLTFELIRQLVRVYGSELVFKNIEKGEMFIDLPGVVLIDEIDAHLHPTWQTRIGQWFLKYFPNLQFIVTTHSPLVCRAAEKGSIWRLAAPGSNEKSGEVTGIDRERLIYGNILDAYGTEVFGSNVTISEESNEQLNRLSELNVKSMMGLIEDKESEELQELRAKFPTENKIKL